MIINSAPMNKAEMSDVGAVSNFRIATSSHAFKILSASLYANKIRAIVRELSCNALDSHIMAGKAEVPFDLHLPTSLEPWFAVKDYGVGLDNDGIVNVYTTYFESLKNDSNDVIGGLGLGSKTPFAYTDNFTVTATHNGMQRIYSAFINDKGVPSVAMMAEFPTDEINGIEVKFPVEQKDFSRFAEEAAFTLKFFPVKPNVLGRELKFHTNDYETENVIPGVHIKTGFNVNSFAVMGNIEYPIDTGSLPKDDIFGLLNCKFEIHFDIGEVEIQPSREGLSYTKQTIDAIRNKLIETTKGLYVKFKQDIDSLDHDWKKCAFLYKKRDTVLWKDCVVRYVIETKFKLFTSYGYRFPIEVNFKDLEKLNISIRAFTAGNTCSEIKPKKSLIGNEYVNSFEFSVTENIRFVSNDTKVGCFERAKYHFRNRTNNVGIHAVVVLTPIKSDKPMDLTKFYEMVYNPPMEYRINASTLDKRETAPRTTNNGIKTPILRLASTYSYYGITSTWEEAGTLDSYDKNKKYVYIPLSGFTTISSFYTDIKEAVKDVWDAFGVKLEVYGVRKSGIEEVKKHDNWINFDTFMIDFCKNIPENVFDVFLSKRMKHKEYRKFSNSVYSLKVDSPFRKFVETISKIKIEDSESKFSELTMKKLSFRYLGNTDKIINELNKKMESIDFSHIDERYPLIDFMKDKFYNESVRKHVVQYVNLIDNQPTE